MTLALSTGHLDWTPVAKSIVDRWPEHDLAALGLADEPRLPVPMPFNTLPWRAAAMTPGGFVEAGRSIVADRGPMRFRRYRSGIDTLQVVSALPAVRRLSWFNRGFMKAEVRDGRVVLNDPHGRRAGLHVPLRRRARRDAQGRRAAIPPERPERPWQATRRLPDVWRRIRAGPVADGAPAAGQ